MSGSNTFTVHISQTLSHLHSFQHKTKDFRLHLSDEVSFELERELERNLERKLERELERERVILSPKDGKEYIVLDRQTDILTP